MTVKELIFYLENMPEDEKVFVPDFNGYDDKEVTNVVFTVKGVVLDTL
jgi:hypothetical protein